MVWLFYAKLFFSSIWDNEMICLAPSRYALRVSSFCSMKYTFSVEMFPLRTGDDEEFVRCNCTDLNVRERRETQHKAKYYCNSKKTLVSWCLHALADVMWSFWCDLFFFSLEPADFLLWPTFFVIRGDFWVMEKKEPLFFFFSNCQCSYIIWSFSFSADGCKISRWESFL